ncbi:MAG: DsbA family protein [Gammaproteobacteria bacterium]
MTGRAELLYFADPMCSWCWGFSPVIEQISQHFRESLPIRVFMGGLAVGVDRPLSASAKEEIAAHWHHVQQDSGQAFDFSFFDRDSFVYNSELPSQAVVAIRNADLDGLGFLSKIQQAFYEHNKDITAADVLVDVAADSGYERRSFTEKLHDTFTIQDTAKDFELTKKLGIKGFPALLGMANERIELLTMGFEKYGPLEEKIESWWKSNANSN